MPARVSQLLPSLLVALTSTVAFASPRVSTAPLKVAVIAVERGLAVEDDLADAAADALIRALQGRGLDVISGREIDKLIAFDRESQRMNCGHGSACLVRLGTALTADRIVSASIRRAGQSTVLSAYVVDVSSGKVERGFQERISGGDAAVLEKLTTVATSLFPDQSMSSPPRPIAGARTGTEQLARIDLGLRVSSQLTRIGGSIGAFAAYRLGPLVSVGGGATFTAAGVPGGFIRVGITPFRFGSLVPTAAVEASILLPQGQVLAGASASLGVQYEFSSKMRILFEVPATWMFLAPIEFRTTYAFATLGVSIGI